MSSQATEMNQPPKKIEKNGSEGISRPRKKNASFACFGDRKSSMSLFDEEPAQLENLVVDWGTFPRVESASYEPYLQREHTTESTYHMIDGLTIVAPNRAEDINNMLRNSRSTRKDDQKSTHPTSNVEDSGIFPPVTAPALETTSSTLKMLQGLNFLAPNREKQIRELIGLHSKE